LESRVRRKLKLPKPHLVQDTAARLRDIILSREPETCIGSLQDVAQLLGVGIVTVQQAARILEHEGLLSVRRGPGGGYYGTRPDEAALERSFAAYLRVRGFSYHESQEMLSVLDCEIIPAAARCKDESLRADARALLARVDLCELANDRIEFEIELRDLLFRMVQRPLMEMLCRVTLRLYAHPRDNAIFPGHEGVAAWKSDRRRILQAIVDQDEDLARFEAERHRRLIRARLRELEQNESPQDLPQKNTKKRTTER
jgi:GntR family transcriptional regulator, transcriptional repressor for pyruvate dehydrogenase complex